MHGLSIRCGNGVNGADVTGVGALRRREALESPRLGPCRARDLPCRGERILPPLLTLFLEGNRGLQESLTFSRPGRLYFKKSLQSRLRPHPHLDAVKPGPRGMELGYCANAGIPSACNSQGSAVPGGYQGPAPEED